jgi:putative endonuclease
MASKKNTVLYIGVSNNLARRVEEHKFGRSKGFTNKYNVHKLVYYEEFREINKAIWREKCLKKWYRAWKDNIITKFNPEWKDLSDELLLRQRAIRFPPARE